MNDNYPNLNIEPPEYDRIKTDAPDIIGALIVACAFLVITILYSLI